MKIALAQLNPTVGALRANAERMVESIRQARTLGADLVVFAELALTGYPPKDLLHLPAFLDEAEAILQQYLLPEAHGIGVLVGTVTRDRNQPWRLHNSAVLLADGQVVGVQEKSLLPTYDVFDELRYFMPAARRAPLMFGGHRLGVTVCEDIWNDNHLDPEPRYDMDPVGELMERPDRPQVILNISASPYYFGKFAHRLGVASHVARTHGVPLVYVNQVGANDDLVFDGGSFVLNATGELVAKAENFAPDLLVVDLDNLPAPQTTVVENESWVRQALVLGIRDYCRKTGFSDVLLGVSGGVDSALVAALAAEALGPEHVLGVTMPSRYSSEGSVSDSVVLCRNLGVELREIPIEGVFKTYLALLNPALDGHASMDMAEENLQPRIRGNYLMFLSNRENRLLLATGNKSEVASGYSTLYGDTCGALAPIADVPKLLVYRLCEQINREAGYDVIPRAILDKAPSAELKPDQKDQDTLPEYDVLDDILRRYVEENQRFEEIVAAGHDPEVVRTTLRRIDRNEFKRRQLPPNLKISVRNFSNGRRMPIAQGWRPV